MVILRRSGHVHRDRPVRRRDLAAGGAEALGCGVSIALTGNYSGLFGPGAAPAQAKGDPAAAATGEAGYGPLVDDPAGVLTAVTTNAE